MNIQQSMINNTIDFDLFNTDHKRIKQQLQENGWVLIHNPGHNVEGFSELMTTLCQKLTFDPARQNITQQCQKVDAGTQAVGLHIENGTTPLAPDIIAFFSEFSASKGSETTICDGHAVWQALPEKLKIQFQQPMTMSRYLPQNIWQKYVADAFHIKDQSQVTQEDLARFIQLIPGQSMQLSHDDGIEYQLQIPMIRHDNLKAVPAFANTLLGPSYNYEKPKFRFIDGSLISQELLDDLAVICEAHTQNIEWQNGDIAIIDNKRMMHGRRAILVPLEQRKLYISMGLGLNPNF